MGQRLVNWENILYFFRWNFYLIRNYMWIRREMPFQVLSFRIYYWHKLYICTHTHIFIFVYTIYLHGSQSTQLKNLWGGVVVGNGLIELPMQIMLHYHYSLLSLKAKKKNDRLFHGCINKILLKYAYILFRSSVSFPEQ